MPRRPPLRAPSAVTVAVAVALAAAACSGTGASPHASASASPTVPVIGSPVAESCAQLVPSSAFSVYSTHFSLDHSATFKANSPAATIKHQRGRVCVFRDARDKTTVTVAVANLPDTALTRLKNRLYEKSNSVPTYTTEGYFDTQKGVGRADAFPDHYWVNAVSTLFGEPGDAEPIMDAVRTALTPSATPSATASTGTSNG